MNSALLFVFCGQMGLSANAIHSYLAQRLSCFWANEENARWAEICILYLILKCNQLFVSGLDSSQHRFFCLHQASRNLLTDGENVQMNLDDTLSNETLMFDV